MCKKINEIEYKHFIIQTFFLTLQIKIHWQHKHQELTKLIYYYDRIHSDIIV